VCRGEIAIACEIEVLGHRAITINFEGHNHVIVRLTALKRAAANAHMVALDGEQVWFTTYSAYPSSTLCRPCLDQPLRLVFGCCHLWLSHAPPYTLYFGQRKEVCGGVASMHFVRWPSG
jgi:hypothetical protein